MTTPRILVIAGSDSGGGAGIQADLKTVTMLGGHAMTAITAITAQNTLGVNAIMPVPAEMVLAQIDAVVGDIGVDAVKIGMIGSAATAIAVADRLKRLAGVPIVFDPVMVATSGSALADAPTINAFEQLMALAAVVTPNAPELALLSGREIGDPHSLHDAARAVANRTGAAILAKGGHLQSDGDGALTDWLVTPGETQGLSWTDPRIDTRHSHGTGCTLASAVASGLGEGLSLVAAIERARRFVRMALRSAPGFGAGHGPIGQQAVRLDVGAGPRLNQWAIDADDLGASKDFYRLLGLTLVVDSAANNYLRFEAPGGTTLSVYQGGDGVFFEYDALDAEVARLRAAGVAFEELPADRPWGWRQAWLRDPAGNRVCLYQAGEYRRFPPWRVN